MASPFVLDSNSWNGNDGNWATFPTALGSAEQTFQLLPCFSNSEVQVLLHSGCTCDGCCPKSRGAGINSTVNTSVGLLSSTTWSLLGFFELSVPSYQSKDIGIAEYGLDSVILGTMTDSNTATLPVQVIGGYNTPEIWLGQLGLGTEPGQFSSYRAQPSLLATMKFYNMIPSLSLGYQAGRFDWPSPGRLVLGGYDTYASGPFNASASWRISSTDAPLRVDVQNIMPGAVIGGGLTDVSQSTFTAEVDSGTSYLWLPAVVCEAIANALGLDYDNTTGYYVLNDTIHVMLQDLNPLFSFSLFEDSSQQTLNIWIPYSALDLYLTQPYKQTATAYFPMQRANSSDERVLGRAFLQAAYLTNDWERRNFSFSQTVLSNSSDSARIQPILHFTSLDTSSDTTSVASLQVSASSLPSKGLNTPNTRDTSHTTWKTGVIVWASIEGVIIFVLVITVGLLVARSMRKRAAAEESEKTYRAELHAEHITGTEIMSSDVNELPADSLHPQIMSNEIHELQPESLLQQVMSTEIFELGSSNISTHAHSSE